MNEHNTLPFGKWGAFNKEHYGILNVADEKTGTTFNVEVFPGFYRRTFAWAA